MNGTSSAAERAGEAAAGYAITLEGHRRRTAAGWRAVGHKIGFTNRTIWARYGVYQPIFGIVYDRTLIEAPDNIATLDLFGFAQPRMEPEICFGLGSTPPRSPDAQAMLGAIEWIAHSIEIVQCALPGWKMRVGDATAANGLHGKLIVGRRIPVREFADLAGALPALEVSLRQGERLVDRGVGANVLDSPLLALAHLVELLATQPDFPQLAAGGIVSTGTLTDAAPVASGETWSTQFSGLALPGITVSYV